MNILMIATLPKNSPPNDFLNRKEIKKNSIQKAEINIDRWAAFSKEKTPIWKVYERVWEEIQEDFELQKQSAEIQDEEFLTPILKAIKDAQYILSLKGNYDEEGSPGYTQETFKKVETFLITYAKNFFRKFGIQLPVPKIYHGPNGSIDILWKNNKCELLINFPPGSKPEASFYGDNIEGFYIKGTFKPTVENPSLIEWLVEL